MKIEINGEKIDSKKYIVTVDSRVYFSVEELCKKIDLKFNHINSNNYSIVNEDNIYYLQSDSSEVEIASSETDKIDSHLMMSKETFMYNDKLYIYVRDLSLFMPIITKWDTKQKTVFIKSYFFD